MEQAYIDTDAVREIIDRLPEIYLREKLAETLDEIDRLREMVGPRRDEVLDEEATNILHDAIAELNKATVGLKVNMGRALDLEYAAGRSAMEKEIVDDFTDIEQRTKKAVWERLEHEIDGRLKYLTPLLFKEVKQAFKQAIESAEVTK